MIDYLPLVTHLSAAATAAMVSAIWQGTLLATLVLLTIRLFPRLSAAARSIIWLNVFMLVALLHVLLLARPAQAAAGHAFHFDPRWSLAVAAVWLALSLARGAFLIAGAFHLRRLARRGAPFAAEDLQDLLRTRGGRVVELCASDEVARPSVLGFFHPRILVPPVLLQRLTAAELRQVVLHEMEHLHRHDDWTNLLQKLGLVLFPLNPALVWVERQLCAERELACDDRVLTSGSGRKAYALCLAHLAEHSLLRRGYALVLGAWERRPELVKRVHRILARPTASMGRRPALAVTGSFVIGALGCALTLAHAPQLVSFTPVAEQARTLAPVNPRDLGLSGTAQLARASMPVHRNVHPAHIVPAKANLTRRVAHPRGAESTLAELRTLPPPQTGTLLVMTEWSNDSPPQVFVAMEPAPPGKIAAPVHGTGHGTQARRAPAIVATYAIVTPNGWLILQI
jgi:hypothetical protein